MRSLVNWALLGLIIDRPSYAYELARRFERSYAGTLSLSSASHIYAALGTLKERRFVEEIPGTGSERQPKPHYRATAQGLDSYREWLVEQLSEDRQRQKLFVLALAAVIHIPAVVLEVIERAEASSRAEAASMAADEDGEDGGSQPGITVERLVREESRLAVAARLEWVEYARREVSSLERVRNGGE